MTESAFGDSLAWRIGENVPWVVPWSEEDEFSFRPSVIFPGLLELTQVERQGVGRPTPSGMNIMRQRQGVIELRCHVCGELTQPGDRFLFPVVTGAFVKIPGGTRYASHVPPTHGKCAEQAQMQCPHLRSRYARPVAFPREKGFVSPERSVPESLRRVADQIAAPGPLVYGYYRIFGEGFTRLVRRLRETNSHSECGPDEQARPWKG